jgi:hypothetical protein
MGFFIIFAYKASTPNTSCDNFLDSVEDEAEQFPEVGSHVDRKASPALRAMVLLTIMNILVVLLSCKVFGTCFYNHRLINDTDYRLYPLTVPSWII